MTAGPIIEAGGWPRVGIVGDVQEVGNRQCEIATRFDAVVVSVGSAENCVGFTPREALRIAALLIRAAWRARRAR